MNLGSSIFIVFLNDCQLGTSIRFGSFSTSYFYLFVTDFTDACSKAVIASAAYINDGPPPM